MTPAALAAAARGDRENFIAAMISDGIKTQEKRGQIEQSFAETLPIQGTSTPKEIAVFEALGFKFGGKVDDLFIETTFPEGWRKKPTSHDMWTDILDDKGVKRGSIFYKAAFYDRSAEVYLDTP